MLLQVITASTRPGRIGPAVTDWFTGHVKDHSGFAVDVVDLAEIDLPLLDEPHHSAERKYIHAHTRRWSRRVASADAFVLVMAEYNTGFTAPLKNALDYLFHEWSHKPVGFVSYGMTSGGMRAVEMIKPVLVALQMVPVHDAVTIHLREQLDAEGVLHPTATMDAAAWQLLTRLRHLGELLSPLRGPGIQPAPEALGQLEASS